MKTIKLLLLAVLLASCSIESIDEEFNATVQSNKADANYRIICSGGGDVVMTNDSFWKINGKIVPEQEAIDKCNEINNE